MSRSQNLESFPEGVILRDLKVNIDERGSFAELFRQDWSDVVKEPIVQANLSFSYPGVVRAWHRHARGQVDYFICLEGKIEVLIKETIDSPLIKIVLDSEESKILRVPGKYWHGYRVISNYPAKVLYFVNKLYDYKSPDEERIEWRE